MAAERADPLAEPDQAVTAPGAGTGRRRVSRAVAHLDGRGGRAVPDADGDRGGVGVLARVGQRLLDDPVHGQPVGGRDGLRVTGEGQFHALARGRGLGDEFGEVPQGGRGDGRAGNDGRGEQRGARPGGRWARLGDRSRTRLRAPPPGVRSHTVQCPGVTVRFDGTGRPGRPQGPRRIGPERAENVAQVVERAGGRGPEQFEAVGEAFRVVRHGADPGPVAQHSGVQDEQAEPVGEDIVHLAGNPGAFGGAGLFGPEFALPAECLDLGVQGPDQDAAAVQPQSEREDGRLDQELGTGGAGPVSEGVGTDRTEPGEHDRGGERRAGAARRGQVVEAEQAGEGAVQQSAEQDGEHGGGDRVAAGRQQGQWGEDGSGHAQRPPGEVVDVPLGEALLDGEHEDGQQEQRLGRAVPAGGVPTEQALLVVHADRASFRPSSGPRCYDGPRVRHPCRSAIGTLDFRRGCGASFGRSGQVGLFLASLS